MNCVHRICLGNRRRRLWVMLLPLWALSACAETTRYPKSGPVEVVLRFSHGDDQPMRQDLGFAMARQTTRYDICHRLMGSWRCDESQRTLYSAEQGALNEAGEIKMVLTSSGPIGDHPSTYCIKGQGYTFMTSPWQQGPYRPQQVIEIRYTITPNAMNCSTYSVVTPKWWPEQK